MKKNLLLLSLLFSQMAAAGSEANFYSKHTSNSSGFETTTTTFANGEEGWIGSFGPSGDTQVVLTGGNPAEYLSTDFYGLGVIFKNFSNPDFVFEYTEQADIYFSIDVKADSISVAGSQEPLPWVIEIRDYNEPTENLPWTSVWYEFAEISMEQTHEWTHYSVNIADTSVTELPPGWGGYGAYDEFDNVILPPGRTFTDVLANMDEIVFTTLKPGYFFSNGNIIISVDNIRIGSEKIFSSSFESEISIYDMEAER